ncbi:MAG TPA: ABC transporter permease [Candidatus Paceibacterota bacterium]|nr:ABC transporter permease [Candidatus Paceibacterota bacterium]
MPSLLDVRVGWYLARRQLKRASLWTTGLIVFVMTLTFLDLVVVTGLLVGIVAGITNLYRVQVTGDVLVSTPDTKNYIDHSQEIISFIKTLPQVQDLSARYVTGGTIEANYLTAVDPNEKPDETGASIVGVDPAAENTFSGLASDIGEGSYLAPGDYDEVLIGSELIDRYSFGKLPGLTPLTNVYPGTKILLTVNGQTREVTVKGIIVTTANSPLSEEVFMPAAELSELMGRTDYNVNEVAIRLKPGEDAAAFRDLLVRSGVSQYATVQTFEEGIPNGVAEITSTFAEIGNAISSVGLVVASITIFIVIFVNAVTRRKFIGILKGIGISAQAIEISYMFQSFFYAAIGSGIGLLIIYGFLVPYFSAHPIVLPISNAIIVAPVGETFLRIALLVVATVIAGFIPARMIVRKNTLDSILGRE